MLDDLTYLTSHNDAFLQTEVNERFKNVPKTCQISITVTTWITMGGLTMIQLLGVVVTYIFVDGVEYPLPLYYHVPFLRPTNWGIYVINLLHHVWAIGYGFSCYVFLFAATLVYFLYTTANFDVLIWYIEQIDTIIAENGFEYWLKITNELIVKNRW